MKKWVLYRRRKFVWKSLGERLFGYAAAGKLPLWQLFFTDHQPFKFSKE